MKRRLWEEKTVRQQTTKKQGRRDLGKEKMNQQQIDSKTLILKGNRNYQPKKLIYTNNKVLNIGQNI